MLRYIFTRIGRRRVLFFGCCLPVIYIILNNSDHLPKFVQLRHLRYGFHQNWTSFQISSPTSVNDTSMKQMFAVTGTISHPGLLNDGTGNHTNVGKITDKVETGGTQGNGHFNVSNIRSGKTENITSGSQVIRVCSQKERLEHIRAYCANQSKKGGIAPWHIIVDDRHKLLYCHIEKAASTTWKQILARSTGKVALNDKHLPVHSASFLPKIGLHHLAHYKRQEFKIRNDEYFRFVVVRHPLDRLVSAWRNKFQIRGYYLNRLTVALYKKSLKSVEFKNVRGVPFSEFARFLQAGHIGNVHWIPMNRVCDPCANNFDAVIRTETGSVDSNSVMERLGKDYLHAGSDVPIIHSVKKDQKNSPPSAKVLSQFKDVPKDLMEFIMRTYGKDLEAWGYKWDQQTLTAKCEIRTSSGDVCC